MWLALVPWQEPPQEQRQSLGEIHIGNFPFIIRKRRGRNDQFWTQTVALTENVNSQTELNLATLSNKNADTYNKMVKSQQVNVDSYKTLIDTMKTKSEAGIPMTKQDEELLEIQRFMVEEGQESLLQEGIDLDGE